jgi:signal transduction histidine kinase
MDIKEVSEQVYDFLMERASILFFVYTKDTGRIDEANEFAYSVFGKDLLTKTVKDVFLDFSGELEYASFGKEEAEKIMISLSSVSNFPQTFLFTFRDLGSRMLVLGEPDYPNTELLQKHLVQANSELANMTRELQKKNFELERLGSLKNEFLGMAAHDMRNPIGNIRNLSQFLLDELTGKLSDSHKLFLSSIIGQSDFLSHLIGDLLDISALESGSVRLDRRWTEFSPFIERIAALNQIIAAKKNITINLPPGPRQIKLFIDPYKMEQVFNNLIDNAVKYSPPNTQVEIEVVMDSGKIAVHIKDQGIGIAERDLSRIFKPFSKIGTSGTSGEKSTGLGLAIVQRIVTAHGGRIQVRSVPGKGSTFIVEVPLGGPGA